MEVSPRSKRFTITMGPYNDTQKGEKSEGERERMEEEAVPFLFENLFKLEPPGQLSSNTTIRNHKFGILENP